MTNFATYSPHLGPFGFHIVASNGKFSRNLSKSPRPISSYLAESREVIKTPS